MDVVELRVPRPDLGLQVLYKEVKHLGQATEAGDVDRAVLVVVELLLRIVIQQELGALSILIEHEPVQRGHFICGREKIDVSSTANKQLHNFKAVFFGLVIGAARLVLARVALLADKE